MAEKTAAAGAPEKKAAPGKPPAAAKKKTAATAKKTAAKKTVAKKTAAADKAPAGKAPAKKTRARDVPPEKAARAAGAVVAGAEGTGPEGPGGGAGGKPRGVARTSGSAQDVAGHSAADDADAAEAAPQTGVTTVGAKKTPGTAATAAKTAVPKARIGAAEPGDLAVRPGEEPWTPDEVEEARTELMSEVLRLREEITSSEQSLAGLMRDSGDGAGDDQADTGTKNITREHELALAANAREMLTQFERALQRLDAGTYGLCENCGNPIGKARMQAFPRATLCVECKQKQERRY
ncbi:TraR/DksA family transcriptional regulator [Streptomyces capillispiralis]|uniref:TraR/DksA family transcriptional regulator n=1 Tax=Streptomyces capillispiralis TaxID=68182 RepID=UPI0011A87FAE